MECWEFGPRGDAVKSQKRSTVHLGSIGQTLSTEFLRDTHLELSHSFPLPIWKYASLLLYTERSSLTQGIFQCATLDAHRRNGDDFEFLNLLPTVEQAFVDHVLSHAS